MNEKMDMYIHVSGIDLYIYKYIHGIYVYIHICLYACV